jgi:hypothetical protein
VEKSIKEKGELTIQLEELTDRVNSFFKHTQNVKLEQQQNEVCMQKAVYTRLSLQ